MTLPSPECRRLTLTLVGDEESGGKFGSQWLMQNVDGCLGDYCINSEPTSLDQVWPPIATGPLGLGRIVTFRR